MKKLLIPVFAIALGFTACDKNDDNVVKTEEQVVDVTKMYLPKKMVTDEYTNDFIYNNKGQLTSIVDSDGYSYSFKYEGDKLVSFEEVDSNSKTTYTFTQAGDVITLNFVNEYKGEKQEGSNKLKVDGKGNLIQDEFFTYIYDAAGNNIKTTDEDEDGVAVMEYDAKNGFFKNVNLPKWVLNYLLGLHTNAANNIVSFDFVSANDPEDNNSGVMEYEYNGDGYPIKVKAKSLDDAGSSSETLEIIYTKN